MNEKELGFVVKAENILGELEAELREIYDSHDDIYSNEHIQTRELLKVIRTTRKEFSEIAGKLIPPSEFDF